MRTVAEHSRLSRVTGHCRRWSFAVSWTTVVAIILTASQWLTANELMSRYRDPIPDDLDAAYVRGMNYLVQTQMRDGNWPDTYGQQPGVIGLAIMALLARGDDPNVGPYSTTIKRGIDAVLKQRDPRHGYLGNTMYNHGFATLALAECYGMVEDPRIGPALEQATAFIVACQSRNRFSAWRYAPESPDADTTVSGTQMVALFAARNAGIMVPEEAIKKGMAFFITCQTPDGGIGYSGPGGPNATRTAIGTLVFALGRQYDSSAFKSALRYIKAAPQETISHYEYYHEYYMSQALFQADYTAWVEWNTKHIKRMLSKQQRDGSWAGQMGNSFSTSAALLSLALNYRYLPIYEKD